jgi:uncharacterized repeat protein (TIGR03803 family)
VTLDAQGNLYGTTLYGGAYNGGTAWEITNGGNTITTLASFSSPITNNGTGPYGGATLDAQGNLYGTTAFGGDNTYGTVWEIVKGSGMVTTLGTFNYTNGLSPFGGLTMDSQGNLFGTTFSGGPTNTDNQGTVFEIVKGSSTITTLASFNGTNGSEPRSAPTLDAQGNLFGTTLNGGTGSAGTVWELAKGSSTITTLASFNGTNGAAPVGGVTFDSHGNLYGTTVAGGASQDAIGTVWEIAKGSNAITTLATFTRPNGQEPTASVTIDAQGNLFGTTSGAGPSLYGTVWEIIHGSDTLQTLAAFAGPNGANPYGSLALATDGQIYGTTLYGGANGDGTVFQLSVPEPSSLVMSIISLALVGGAVVLKRRR